MNAEPRTGPAKTLASALARDIEAEIVRRGWQSANRWAPNRRCNSASG